MTPFRVSFFGGGTDYPSWFKENGGLVLSTTIDKFCYITCRYLPPFFEHKHRLVYSRVETVKNIQDIQHPAVRGILSTLKIEKGMEIHHDGDLPARSGLGSSSAFTVGLLNAIYALSGEHVSDKELAKQAIHIEQEVLKEHVGSQDQIAAAVGGLNQIQFFTDGTFSTLPLIVNQEKKELLESHLMLFFTGISRYASQIAQSKIENFKNRTGELKRLAEMTHEGLDILRGPEDFILEFSKLIDESWQIKKRLSDKVSTPVIDQIFDSAKNAGALGGKLLGAGGGGFLLLLVPPERKANVRNKLNNLTEVPFKFEHLGSRIALYQPNGLM